VAPNGGETWYWPDYEVIAWYYAGWWQNGAVDIELRHDGQVLPLVNWCAGVWGYGQHSIAVPQITSNDCRIRIYASVDHSIYDDSNYPFKIQPYPSAAPIWYLLMYECMNIPPNPISQNPGLLTQDYNPVSGYDTWDTPPWSAFNNYVAYSAQLHDGYPNPDPWYHPNAEAVLERLQAVNTSEAKDIKFQFWAKIDLPYWDTGDYLEPYYTPNNVSWISLGKIYGTNPRPSEPLWQLFEFPNLGMMPLFRYKFLFHTNAVNMHDGVNWYWAYGGVWIDEIKVFGKFYVDSTDSNAEADLSDDPFHLPREFSLEQNSPNPFNGRTVIRYGLPQDAKVSLVIYDIAGREVATLFDSPQTVGYHELTFDGSRFASGLYFYLLDTGSFRGLKKNGAAQITQLLLSANCFASLRSTATFIANCFASLHE
jgi:hypothetical protein